MQQHNHPRNRGWLDIKKLYKEAVQKIKMRAHGLAQTLTPDEVLLQRNENLLRQLTALRPLLKNREITELDEALCDFILDYTRDDHEETPYVKSLMALYEEVTSYRA